MVLTIENILLIGSILLLVSIVAGKTSYRFGVPTLILFLAIGMIAGTDGLGIQFDDPQTAQFIGIVSLNFILFSGGLDTDWVSIRPVFWQGISLSSLGVLFTALALGTFVWLITDFTIYEGLLLGAIVSSTDAAAVFSILRSSRLALKSKLRPILELESGSNDPMAYALTIAFLGLVLNGELSILTVVPLLIKQMVIGGLAGFFFGKISIYTINKIRLDFEGLYPVLVISLMFITFSITDFVGGNGFLAIYVCAVYLGNQDFIHKKSVMQVFDGLAWLMQIVLFLTLGLLVVPSHIIPVMGLGIFISLFLILISRPLSVFLSLVPFRMRFRNRVYISWVGLRGAVPIVFATYPLIAGIEKAHMIFNIVFFVSVLSVLIQGTSLSVIAKWLHVALPEKVKYKSSVDLFLAERARTVMAEIEVPPDGYAAGKEIVELHFPQSSSIALINRQGIFISPSGSTVIEPNDILVVISDNKEGLGKVYDCLKVEKPERFN
jgi:potassium/hydrogen antiporter